MVKEEDDALEIVKKSAKNIVDIATIINKAYTTVAKKVRPDYKACAKDFRSITRELTAYARNLQEFISTFYYYSFYKEFNENIESLNALFKLFRSKEPWKWAGSIKFRCGEIGHIYSHNCESWVKNYYGSHVSKRKQSEANSQLKKLTEIDAKLVDVLTKDVFERVKNFIDRADEALREKPPNIDKTERAHRKLRETLKPVMNQIDDLITKLEDAAIGFESVAHSK